MIKDRIDHAEAYRGLGAGIARALDYLKATDFAAVSPGRYEVDGDCVFAVVQRYVPKPLADAAWETHRKFIDVQYIAAGAERMGYFALTPGLPVKHAYNNETDLQFYHASGDLIEFAAGEFGIFTPCDVHAPQLVSARAPAAAEVLKVVVKVKVNPAHPCGF